MRNTSDKNKKMDQWSELVKKAIIRQIKAKKHPYGRNTSIRSPQLIRIKEIQGEIGISYMQVRRRIDKLVKNGEIERFSTTFCKNGQWQRATYLRVKP